MPRVLVRPEAAIFTAVIDEAIRPLLTKLSKQLRLRIPTAVTVWTPGMIGPSVLVEDASGQDANGTGECRVYFKETYGRDRLLFMAEAIYPKEISPTTGFSGFEVEGDVTLAHGEVQTKGWTGRYNVWDWQGWQ
ncbi:MAG: hypothetical protein ABI672_19445 [Vicinamibacteria bacterium]